MSSQLAIDMVWEESNTTDKYDRATFASIIISAGKIVFTEVEDFRARSVRPSVRLSAYRLAYWFAENWWRLRWEPETNVAESDWQLSHHMGATGGGYVWPSLVFSSDGGHVVVRARRTHSPSTELVRYLNDDAVVIPIQHFEQAIDNFIETVIHRLEAIGLKKSPLAHLWQEVVDERRDVNVARTRKLEALLGFDPDLAPSVTLQSLHKAAEWAGLQAVEEVAAAVQGREAVNSMENLQKMIGKGRDINVSNIEKLRQAYLFDAEINSFPWQHGLILANIARKNWKITSGPVSNDKLSEIFSFDPVFLTEVKIQSDPIFTVGFRSESCLSGFNALLKNRYETGRRFELARLIADCITNQNDKLLPVTKSKTERQKLQRAFASEFLCPLNDLINYLPESQPDVEDIEGAADVFGVSPLMVRTILVNNGRLDREVLAA